MNKNPRDEREGMGDKGRRSHENPVPMGGIFLLFLGVVFLLQTVGLLSWSLWNTLWRYWPVLLIITGLGILLRRYNVWLVTLALLAVLFGCLALAIWQEGQPPPVPGPANELLF